MALEQRRVEKAKEDEVIREQRGWNSESWRLWRVELLDEAKANFKAQQEAEAAKRG